mmetsp:Transcript_63785/g.150076  ORF Transcript_63785/g.150076 Transcript_63785/m.150076 type:complete len:267 (-) Transcript_63785:178-978(-)
MRLELEERGPPGLGLRDKALERLAAGGQRLVEGFGGLVGHDAAEREVADLEALGAARAREGDVGLAVGEAAREVDHHLVERLALALVHRQRPRQLQRDLHPHARPDLVHLALERLRQARDHPPVAELHHRQLRHPSPLQVPQQAGLPLELVQFHRSPAPLAAQRILSAGRASLSASLSDSTSIIQRDALVLVRLCVCVGCGLCVCLRALPALLFLRRQPAAAAPLALFAPLAAALLLCDRALQLLQQRRRVREPFHHAPAPVDQAL